MFPKDLSLRCFLAFSLSKDIMYLISQKCIRHNVQGNQNLARVYMQIKVNFLKRDRKLTRSHGICNCMYEGRAVCADQKSQTRNAIANAEKNVSPDNIQDLNVVTGCFVS